MRRIFCDSVSAIQVIYLFHNSYIRILLILLQSGHLVLSSQGLDVLLRWTPDGIEIKQVTSGTQRILDKLPTLTEVFQRYKVTHLYGEQIRVPINTEHCFFKDL